MKKKIVNLVLLVMIVGLFNLPVFAKEDIKVVLNGKTLDAPAIMENNSVLVPLRSIFEALGAEVDWYGDTKEIRAKKEDLTEIIGVYLQIDNKTAAVDGKEIELIAKPKIYRGTTYVPLRFVSESFGADVEWNGKTRTVNIYKSFKKPEITYSVYHNSNKKGLRDSNKNTVIPPDYQDLRYIRQDSGNMVAVKKDGLWGYVNLSNEVVIPFQYEDASCFYGDYAFISMSTDELRKKWLLIDKTGTVVDDTMIETRLHVPVMHKLTNLNYIVTSREYDAVGSNFAIDKYWLLKDGKVYFLLEKAGNVNTERPEFMHISDEINLIKRDKKTWVIDIEGNKLFEIKSSSSIYDTQETIRVYGEKGEILTNNDSYLSNVKTNWDPQDLPSERIFVHYHSSDGVAIYNAKGKLINEVEPYTYAHVIKGGYIFIDNRFDFEDSSLSIIDFKGKKYFDMKDIEKADERLKDIEIPLDLNTFVNRTIVTKVEKSKRHQVRDLKFDILFEYECESLIPVYGDCYEAIVKDQWGNEDKVLLDSQGKEI